MPRTQQILSRQDPRSASLAQGIRGATGAIGGGLRDVANLQIGEQRRQDLEKKDFQNRVNQMIKIIGVADSDQDMSMISNLLSVDQELAQHPTVSMAFNEKLGVTFPKQYMKRLNRSIREFTEGDLGLINLQDPVAMQRFRDRQVAEIAQGDPRIAADINQAVESTFRNKVGDTRFDNELFPNNGWNTTTAAPAATEEPDEESGGIFKSIKDFFGGGGEEQEAPEVTPKSSMTEALAPSPLVFGSAPSGRNVTRQSPGMRGQETSSISELINAIPSFQSGAQTPGTRQMARQSPGRRGQVQPQLSPSGPVAPGLAQGLSAQPFDSVLGGASPAPAGQPGQLSPLDVSQPDPVPAWFRAIQNEKILPSATVKGIEKARKAGLSWPEVLFRVQTHLPAAYRRLQKMGLIGQ